MLPNALIAAKHPPEYRLHKYWARKPANVVAAFLTALVPPGGQVLDPFCGSGVVLAEARALGLEATGIDLNPAATLIADVTANPPDPDAFDAALAAFLREAHAALDTAYRLPDGTPLRFAVHSGVVLCPDCGARVRAWDVRAAGRARVCPACGTRLHFNLETLIGTEIVEVAGAESARWRDPAWLVPQQAAAYDGHAAASVGTYRDTSLLPNPRILAHPGMTVADLFTPRNRAAALTLARLLDALPPTPETRALRALFSAALAGFTRLIPYRAGLRGGGPAWSVPGFWVAPVHIEHNPLPLLESWARRYRAGLRRLDGRLRDGPPAIVRQGDAATVLADLAGQERRYALIFLDPPYGDSIPYLEFSALWNAFLGLAPDYGQEVVVSNRTAQPAGWAAYEARLGACVASCARVLAEDGALLVTFNNLDGRAWEALLRALHAAGLRCAEVHYVAPAVISAKAQFAPDGSYHGDFWCVFRRGPLPDVPPDSWPDVLTAGIPPDVTDPQRRRRLALRALLAANLPAEAIQILNVAF